MKILLTVLRKKKNTVKNKQTTVFIFVFEVWLCLYFYRSNRAFIFTVCVVQEQGYLPEAVVSYVTTIGGGFNCDTSSLTLQELVQHVSAAIF